MKTKKPVKIQTKLERLEDYLTNAVNSMTAKGVWYNICAVYGETEEDVLEWLEGLIADGTLVRHCGSLAGPGYVWADDPDTIEWAAECVRLNGHKFA